LFEPGKEDAMPLFKFTCQAPAKPEKRVHAIFPLVLDFGCYAVNIIASPRFPFW